MPAPLQLTFQIFDFLRFDLVRILRGICFFTVPVTMMHRPGLDRAAFSGTVQAADWRTIGGGIFARLLRAF